MLEFAPYGDRKFETTKYSTYQVNLSQDGRLLGVEVYRISSTKNLGNIYWYRSLPMGLPVKEFMRKRANNMIELCDTYSNWKRTVELFPG